MARTVDFPRFLFDCDGTLFNTEELKAQSWGEGYFAAILTLVVRTHARLTQEVFRWYKAGPPAIEVGRSILERGKERLPGEISRIVDSIELDGLVKARELAKSVIFDQVFPKSGVTAEAQELIIQPIWDFASKSREEGFEVGLVTTTDEESVRRYVRASGVRDHRGIPIEIERFFSVRIFDKRKALGIKEAICRMRQLPLGAAADEREVDEQFRKVGSEDRERFIIFEDSGEGIRAAKSVGIHVVAVPNNFTRDEVREATADLVVDPSVLGRMTPQELLTKILATR